MELERQVCSIDLAKTLNKLGVDQLSLYYWFRIPRDIWKLGSNTEMLNTAVDIGHTTAPQFDSHSAFTVAELGEMLPSYNYYFAYSFKGNMPDEPWSCIWIFAQENKIKHQVNAATEADVRAKMLIYLLENKLITSQSL
jgi:hypothetical protein